MHSMRIKFCGMTRKEDIDAAVCFGADAVGLIFYSGSPRYVSIEQAKILLASIPPFVEVVAVLVNPEPELVSTILDQLPVSLLQFHGEESSEFCLSFGKRFIKTIPAKSRNHILEYASHFEQARALLLDTSSQEQKGGTGVTFDWNMIPASLPKPWILAGGIHAENVLEAMHRVHPYAVDVCSGVESAPGIKDHQKMKQFIDRVRGRE